MLHVNGDRTLSAPDVNNGGNGHHSASVNSLSRAMNGTGTAARKRLEDRLFPREPRAVNLNKGRNGLGFNIVGGEDAEGFELGIKTTLLDGRLRLNVTAYDYEFRDLQVSQFRPETTTFVIGNAASASSKGVEFDIVMQASDRLQLYAEFGYNDAKQDSYPNVACYAFQTVEQGCVDPDGDGLFFQDLSGKRLANAPKFSGSMGFRTRSPTKTISATPPKITSNSITRLFIASLRASARPCPRAGCGEARNRRLSDSRATRPGHRS